MSGPILFSRNHLAFQLMGTNCTYFLGDDLLHLLKADFVQRTPLTSFFERAALIDFIRFNVNVKKIDNASSINISVLND